VQRSADGYPVSRHSYDTLVYLPTVNRMLCIGNPAYHRIGFDSLGGTDQFDFGVDPSRTNPWTHNDEGTPGWRAIDLVSGYNSATGMAWGLGHGNGTRLRSYHVASNRWAWYAKDHPHAVANSKAAIDPTRNRLVVLGTGGAVCVQDLDRPTSAIYQPRVTGTGPGRLANMLEWDSAGSRFVAWGRSGRSVFFLTPGLEVWVWSSQTPSAGATPADAVPNGTYGRFRMHEGSLRGIVLMATASAPICFYKM
jgi:hypothetical protein